MNLSINYIGKVISILTIFLQATYSLIELISISINKVEDAKSFFVRTESLKISLNKTETKDIFVL